MAKMTPYLLFQGKCEEAMTFYKDCLNGELQLTKVGDSPMAAQFPKELHDRVINAVVTTNDFQLSASDWLHPTEKPVPGNTVCIYITGATYDELRQYFDKLRVGAQTDYLEELREMPFGSYGALTDKFGVRWMFQGDKK